MNIILKNRKKRGKTRQKLESGENQVYAQKPRLKLPFKNIISVETRLQSRDRDHTGKHAYRNIALGF